MTSAYLMTYLCDFIKSSFGAHSIFTTLISYKREVDWLTLLFPWRETFLTFNVQPVMWTLHLENTAF